jgi:hypothetical protein
MAKYTTPTPGKESTPKHNECGDILCKNNTTTTEMHHCYDEHPNCDSKKYQEVHFENQFKDIILGNETIIRKICL